MDAPQIRSLDGAKQPAKIDAVDRGRDVAAKKSSWMGRLIRAALLYAISGSTVLIGLALIKPMPMMALGMIGAAALLMPIARRLTFGWTGIRLPRAGRIALVLALLVLPMMIQNFSKVIAENDAERGRLTAELAAAKPTVLSTLTSLIDSGAYRQAIDEADRYKLVHDAEIDTLASKARQALDARIAAEAQVAQRQEQVRCDASDDCFAKQYQSEARRQCKPVIEVYARYDHRWTDGFGGPPTFFSAYVDRIAGTIRFAGNQLKLRNGFGVWQQYRYECLFDYRRNSVVSTEVNG